jgi:hypothetical protein
VGGAAVELDVSASTGSTPHCTVLGNITSGRVELNGGALPAPWHDLNIAQRLAFGGAVQDQPPRMDLSIHGFHAPGPRTRRPPLTERQTSLLTQGWMEE